MLLRLTHYFTALVFLIASAVVYQNVLTPWLDAPVVEPVAIKHAKIVRNDDSLKDLFADGAWQRRSCKQLQTSEGMLLFEKWEQTADDQWKLWPVTVVIGRGLSGAKTRDPVVIEAAEGAEIKFTESLDMMSGGAPPIDRGRMIGAVHIYRASSDGDSKRSLDLQTANVGIDNRKIWTTEAIEMQVGQARMVGRDLTIHLAGGSSPGSRRSAAILDRMELIYLDQLVMPLDNDKLWKSTQSSANASQPPPTPEPAATAAMISVACGGRVEYDFAIDQLLLRDSVSLVHQVPGSLPDRFDCQSLELRLNDPANDKIVRSGPMDWLVKVIATGSPAVAKLPSFDTEIAAERIEFNASAGLVSASGGRGILARRGGITARLAKMVYQFDPKHPETIGAVDAQGAGIVTIDDPTIAIRKVQWRDGFRLRPVGVATAKHLDTDVELWIDGQIHAWFIDGGEFKADSIAGVLTPEPATKPGERATLAPDRFEVTGNVRIDTTAIAAETQRLLLYFVSEADPQPRTTAEADRTAISPLRQWVSQPDAGGEMVDPIARQRPVIRGDSINAQLRRNASGLSAKKLSVVGSVEVVHALEAGGQMLPARLTGEQLQLIDGGGEDVLQLGSGVDSPARFDLGDGFFVGPQIQIRPSDNLIWINAAGEFQIPTAALPTGLASDQRESNVKWTKPPHCRWQGEMIFDGRRAVLSEGVDITASLVNGREPWELQLSGDRLQVDLLEDVQVRDMNAMRGATIQKISMMQTDNRPVIAHAIHRAPDGVMEAKHLIHASTLTMTPAAGGKLVGSGPGWYRGWMRAKSNPALGMESASTLIDSADRELTGIHLTFNDSMQADLTGRNLDFLRGVRVGVRAVEGWNDAFDAAEMDAISMGESTLDCDRLRFTIEPGQLRGAQIAGMSTPWEMEATSGVVFRTRNDRGLLEGTANRAAYSSSKDLFTVEGAPNRAAIFRQTRPDGQKGPEGAVRTITIRPKTMKIENAVFERLNIATPPGGGNR